MASQLNTTGGDNRFRYQSFKSRLDKLQLNTVYKPKRYEEEPEETGSYFKNAIGTWKELNLTTPFSRLLRQVESLSQSLPQLLYHKDQIVAHLIGAIKVEDGLALQPVLDLTAQLARDLGEDIFPYYPQIVEAVIPWSRARDTETVEWVFNCLAALFKHLLKSLIPDLIPTFRLLLPLLRGSGSQSAHIRLFAAESFAFLLRKSRGASLHKIITYMIETNRQEQDPNVSEGVVMIFFESTKQVNHQLHSRCIPILKSIICALKSISTTTTSKDTEQLVETIQLLLVQHSDAEHFTPIWTLLLEELDKSIAEFDYVAPEHQSTAVTHLRQLLQMVWVCGTARKGTRVTSWPAVTSRLARLAEKFLPSDISVPVDQEVLSRLRSSILRNVASVLMFCPLEVRFKEGKILLDLVFAGLDVNTLSSFISTLSKAPWSAFQATMLPYITTNLESHRQLIVLLLADLIQNEHLQFAPGSISSLITQDGLWVLGKANKETTLQLTAALTEKRDWMAEADALNGSSLTNANAKGQISYISATLAILHRISIDTNIAIKAVHTLLESLFEELALHSGDDIERQRRPFASGRRTFPLETLFGIALGTYVVMQRRMNAKTASLKDLHDVVLAMLQKYTSNESLLRGTYEYLLELKANAASELFSETALTTIYDVLQRNLSKTHSNIRLYSLQILQLYERQRVPSTNEPTDIIDMCQEAEEIEPSMQRSREKIVQIKRIVRALSLDVVPKYYAEAPIRLALGFLTINLQPLWSEAIAIIKGAAAHWQHIVWAILFAELKRFEDDSGLIEDYISDQVLSAFFARMEKSKAGPIERVGRLALQDSVVQNVKIRESEARVRFTDDIHASYLTLLIKSMNPMQERMDYWNYHSLLLTALKELHGLAESQSEHLVPCFLDFLHHDYYRLEDADQGDDPKLNEQSVTEAGLEKNGKIIRNQLSLWLALFARFRSPQRMHKSDELYDIYLRFLTVGDSKLQLQALDCILAWRAPELTPYAEKIRNLLDDVKFRDELATLALNEEESDIDPQHRHVMMQIVVRILYGRMISRKGKRSAKAGMGARRTAVLSALAACSQEELGSFINLMLEPFERILEAVQSASEGMGIVLIPDIANITELLPPWRKQMGFLNILEDVLKQLGGHLGLSLPKLLVVALSIAKGAQHEGVNAVEVDTTDREESAGTSIGKHSKEARQLALRRLIQAMNLPLQGFDFKAYMPAVFDILINDRIPNFAPENTQSPSALLDLFLTWSSRIDYATFLVNFNDNVLTQVITILSEPKLKNTVLGVVLTILENLLSLCVAGEPRSTELQQAVLKPHVSLILENLQVSLSKASDDKKFGKESFSVRQIAIVSQIADFVQDGKLAQRIINLLLPSLRRNPRIVPEKTKGDILKIVYNFLPIVPQLDAASPDFERYYSSIAILFSELNTRECRQQLVNLMHLFARLDNSLESIWELVDDLNAFSAKRLDMPDFDRRLDAFTKIYQDRYGEFNARQWLPILFNFLFFIQDTEELSIRNSATLGLCRFIDCCQNREQAFQNQLVHVIYPGIKKGMKHPVELVRMEYIAVLAHAVKHCDDINQFSDMRVLLADGDEEASFFNNVYHMQIHRRIRALRRLGEQVDKGGFLSSTLVHIFLPIIAHFLFEGDTTADHNLINEAISTMGIIAKQLPWNAYYTVLRQYLRMIPKKPEMEKLLVRVVMSLLNAFHFDLSSVHMSQEEVDAVSLQNERVQLSLYQEWEEDAAPAPVEAEDKMEQDEAEDIEMDADMPDVKDLQGRRIHNIVITKLLPELNRYLNSRDEASVLLRIPVSLGMVKLLKALPENSMRTNLPSVLTTVCQVLKSRQQEARDVTRETLLKIVAFLGPDYFSFVLKEMRSALLRGYQLHVLGFTLNSLLIDMLPRLEVGDLDYCLNDIVDVLINDIFGETGVEKETEEIKGKTKEAKSMRSYESFEFLAKVVDFGHMMTFLMPLRELMSETESTKVTNKIDELLRRLAIGLNGNPQFETKAMMIFAHSLVSQKADFATPKDLKIKEKSLLETNYTVQLKRNFKEPADYLKANIHRFVEFGLSILLSALRRRKFDAKNQQDLELLDPFVNVVGNILYSKHSKVTILSCRVLAVLCTFPLPSVKTGIAAIIQETFVLIKGAGGTSSELAQACFRLLTAAIRHCPWANIKEHQLSLLINLIKPDLEQPDRQGITFALLRAIISRQFLAPEVYDIMDDIGDIMITSQDKQVRELCRTVMLSFLLDYPQGKKRLAKRMQFLVQNLEYVHESGRQSAMEMMHVVMAKFGALLNDYVDMFFLALTMRLVNDDSSQCREMAGALIKSLIKKMDESQANKTFTLVEAWAKSDQVLLQRAALQTEGLWIEVFDNRFPRGEVVMDHVGRTLEASAKCMDQLQDEGWQLGYYALTTLLKLARAQPAMMHTHGNKVWLTVKRHLVHPHVWVKLASARAIGLLFSSIDPVTRRVDGNVSELSLWHLETLRGIVLDCIAQLRSEYLSEDLAMQVCKNLVFLGKWFYHLPKDLDVYQAREEEEEEEEDEGESNASDSKHQDRQRSLFWLLRRLSYVARGAEIKHTGTLLRQTVFRTFAAMTHILQSNLVPYLLPIMTPLFRTIKLQDQPPELVQLAEETLQLIRNTLPNPQLYNNLYAQLQSQLVEKRSARRQARAIERVNDPQQAAQKRHAKHVKQYKRQRVQ
ncbi:hypothetical protein BZG36_00549 [Bifiguratus adelaidae]|uniref:Uncharacterized protein n=1 Tax=Bifiguratus adelaidae TaxID=1938954 RepID=A0A261Y7G3_9FUNG|nr:hypothetical protein BZG36_00549 [Bifiguratus adelaidae]